VLQTKSRSRIVTNITGDKNAKISIIVCLVSTDTSRQTTQPYEMRKITERNQRHLLSFFKKLLEIL